jgi:hypothetical protein
MELMMLLAHNLQRSMTAPSQRVVHPAPELTPMPIIPVIGHQLAGFRITKLSYTSDDSSK